MQALEAFLKEIACEPFNITNNEANTLLASNTNLKSFLKYSGETLQVPNQHNMSFLLLCITLWSRLNETQD